MNSNLGENSKESSSSRISTKASFNDDTSKETLNVNKTCGCFCKWDVDNVQTLLDQAQKKELQKIL